MGKRKNETVEDYLERKRAYHREYYKANKDRLKAKAKAIRDADVPADGNCNTGIGKLGDNAAGLRRALAYLNDAERVK